MAQLNIREILGSKLEGIDAHLVSDGDLAKRFGTVYETFIENDETGYFLKGLTEEQAAENLKKYGPNKIERDMDMEFTMVKRENELKEFKWKQIKTEDVVPGDVVQIDWDNIPAEKRETMENLFIPADIRITQLFAYPTRVESYFLYRERLNFEKMVTFKHTREDPFDPSLETCNLVFQGCSISAGLCEGIVFQTGENMLLSEVSADLLATPVIADSDEEENEGQRDENPEVDITFHKDTIEEICERFNTDVNTGLTTEQVAINQGKSGKNNKHCKIPNYTRCKRDGEFQHVLSKRLTIGDIISMKGPQIVPADIRIIEASEDCEVAKCQLTGESNPQKVSCENTSENPLDTENLVLASTTITTGTCTGIVVLVGLSTVSGRVSGLGGSF